MAAFLWWYQQMIPDERWQQVMEWIENPLRNAVLPPLPGQAT